MSRTNKFQIDWQIVRVKAKSIKDVALKIVLVKKFLIDNPSRENYDRVKNWATMTSYAYKDLYKKDLFIEFLVFMETLTYDKPDLDNDFSRIALSDLLMVHKDLSKRKYNFHFGNHVPKSHTRFMESLTVYLEDEKDQIL